MIRISTVFWTLAVVIAGYAMFQVKFHVVKLDDELARLNRQIASVREETRVLKAEWTLLDDPRRLDRLNGTFLKLQPIAPTQIVQPSDLGRIPLRNTPTAALPAVPPQIANARTPQ